MIFQGVQIGEGSVVRNSVIMTNTRIGKGVIIDKAIIGENSVINDDCVLGYGEEVPHETHPGIYDSGIVVVGYDAVIPAGTKIGKNCAIANHVREGDFSGDVQGGKTIAAKE